MPSDPLRLCTTALYQAVEALSRFHIPHSGLLTEGTGPHGTTAAKPLLRSHLPTTPTRENLRRRSFWAPKHSGYQVSQTFQALFFSKYCDIELNSLLRSTDLKEVVTPEVGGEAEC